MRRRGFRIAIVRNPKTNTKKLSWKQRLLKVEPSPFLQKVSIWFGILMAGATSILAYMSYNANVRIDGMEDVLNTFTANVRPLPIDIRIRNDTVDVYMQVVNYGVRSASNIDCKVYAIRYATREASGISVDISDVLPTWGETSFSDAAANERFDWKFSIPNSSDKLPRWPLVPTDEIILGIRVIFQDVTTKSIDSSYVFISNAVKHNIQMPHRILSREQEQWARKKLIENRIDF